MNEPPQKRPWRDFVHRFLVSTFAVLIAVNMVEGITYKSWEQLLLASLVLGALNAFVRPLLLLGCLPLLILSLGLFLLVINATLLWLTGLLVDGTLDCSKLIVAHPPPPTFAKDIIRCVL